jgi:alpha-galactosidase
MIRDWGFDGLKIDGQNLNAVPPCYNPLHHHSSPRDAPAALPEFFRQLNATAHALKPDAVLSLCPCGTTFSLYHLPYVQQPVGSDPRNAWQVRLRAKAYKALLGGNVPYSGDHVELTNRSWDENTQAFRVLGEEDFASTVGVGGVVSTKFTLPGIVQPDPTLALVPAKEKRWQQWFDTYRREKLSEGEYLNLYDIAFDRPETHVIRKGPIMYYAFFALAPYRGAIRLRGLEPGSFDVIDYVAGKSLGTVTSASPSITVAFSGALLLKAVPQTKAKK